MLGSDPCDGDCRIAIDASLSPPSSHLTSNLAPIFPQHYPETTTATTTTSTSHLSSRPTVTAKVVSQDNSSSSQQEREASQTMGGAEDEEEEISSKQLLANINKLATQAAANLRSLPHF